MFERRTGLRKVGLPGADLGMRAEDPTIAELLKPLGYTTGQFGKNHLGDKDEMLPSNHGFDEFYGNLYHLNAEEEPELQDYPTASDFPEFHEKYGPRGLIHSFADGRIEDTGPLTRKRMETIDDDVAARSAEFIEKQHKAGSVSNQLMSHMDWMPTLLATLLYAEAGAALGTAEAIKVFHGFDLARLNWKDSCPRF